MARLRATTGEDRTNINVSYSETIAAQSVSSARGARTWTDAPTAQLKLAKGRRVKWIVDRL